MTADSAGTTGSPTGIPDRAVSRPPEDALIGYLAGAIVAGLLAAVAYSL